MRVFLAVIVQLRSRIGILIVIGLLLLLLLLERTLKFDSPLVFLAYSELKQMVVDYAVRHVLTQPLVVVLKMRVVFSPLDFFFL